MGHNSYHRIPFTPSAGGHILGMHHLHNSYAVFPASPGQKRRLDAAYQQLCLQHHFYIEKFVPWHF